MAPKARNLKEKRRYVRAIDELGRVVVPVEFRRRFGLADGSPVEMYVDGDRVCLLAYQEACMFCGLPATFGQFRGRSLCRSCAESLALLSERAGDKGEGEGEGEEEEDLDAETDRRSHQGGETVEARDSCPA